MRQNDSILPQSLLGCRKKPLGLLKFCKYSQGLFFEKPLTFGQFSSKVRLYANDTMANFVLHEKSGGI